jgi:hypothetical protein
MSLLLNRRNTNDSRSRVARFFETRFSPHHDEIRSYLTHFFIQRSTTSTSTECVDTPNPQQYVCMYVYVCMYIYVCICMYVMYVCSGRSDDGVPDVPTRHGIRPT